MSRSPQFSADQPRPVDLSGMRPGRLGQSNGRPSIEWWRPGRAAQGEPSTVTRVVEYESETVRDRVAADALSEPRSPELLAGLADVADAEYQLLLREAQDACARRVSSSASVGSSDAALHDLKFRVRRLDAMSQEQLLASAQRRQERASAASAEMPADSTPTPRPRA